MSSDDNGSVYEYTRNARLKTNTVTVKMFDARRYTRPDVVFVITPTDLVKLLRGHFIDCDDPVCGLSFCMESSQGQNLGTTFHIAFSWVGPAGRIQLRTMAEKFRYDNSRRWVGFKLSTDAPEEIVDDAIRDMGFAWEEFEDIEVVGGV